MQLYESEIDRNEYSERYKNYIKLYNRQMKKYNSNRLMNPSLKTMQRILTPLKTLFKQNYCLTERLLKLLQTSIQYVTDQLFLQ